MFGWLKKKSAKVHPEGRAKKIHTWKTLRGEKAAKHLKEEFDREAESDAKNRKANREGKGGRRRRTMRY